MKDSLGFDRPDVMEWMFLSSNPCIARFPHVLVKSGEATLRAVSAATGARLGLWGQAPTFRADGRHYLEPDSGKIEEDFVLWKLSSNQANLLQIGTISPDPSFKMFISADVPVTALKRTYEHFAPDFDDAPAFADYINYVCDWLPSIGWALIPLEGEMGWSIFAAHNAKYVVEKLSAEFLRNGFPVGELVQNQPTSWRIEILK